MSPVPKEDQTGQEPMGQAVARLWDALDNAGVKQNLLPGEGGS